jgi:hypothetical protein
VGAEVIVVLVMGASVLAALLVNGEIQRRSQAKGDGLFLMWNKGGLAGCCTMIAVCVIALVIANIVKALV